jgi:hypothetical protein
MPLNEFIATHRDELVRRTRAKVANRSSPQPSETELEHGVPIFLSQVTKALEQEEGNNPPQKGQPVRQPEPATAEEILSSATLHGQELRTLGFTIDQVVHGYGDVCQAVTELALERDATVTTAEFRTLNRCLDNAIAGAVLSWNKDQRPSPADGPWHSLEQELGVQLDIAIPSFDALRAGRVGTSGVTASVVGECLSKMRTLLGNPKRKR